MDLNFEAVDLRAFPYRLSREKDGTWTASTYQYGTWHAIAVECPHAYAAQQACEDHARAPVGDQAIAF